MLKILFCGASILGAFIDKTLSMTCLLLRLIPCNADRSGIWHRMHEKKKETGQAVSANANSTIHT